MVDARYRQVGAKGSMGTKSLCKRPGSLFVLIQLYARLICSCLLYTSPSPRDVHLSIRRQRQMFIRDRYRQVGAKGSMGTKSLCKRPGSLFVLIQLYARLIC